jgi:dTDP-4-amino-4,6-dideoxy-D-galactose acyltransferase
MREVTLLPWDTEHFGVRIARLDGDHRDLAELEPALAACVSQQIACAYCSVPVGDAAWEATAVRALEGTGFHLVDQRVTLDRRITTGDAAEIAGPVREACPEDIPALRAIAATSHTDSRFYADPGFSRERCDELYRVWIEKSCRGYASFVLTEGPAGDPAGYITGHVEGAEGRIGLVAVGASHQGRGVGSRLVEAAVRRFAGAGVGEVTVPTQARNVRAQRLYQSAGFKSRSVSLWYHKWFA